MSATIPNRTIWRLYRLYPPAISGAQESGTNATEAAEAFKKTRRVIVQSLLPEPVERILLFE